MIQPIKKLQLTISEGDQRDALRLVESAVTLVALPGLASPVARELAATRIRELIANHPAACELLAAVVTHIESRS